MAEEQAAGHGSALSAQPVTQAAETAPQAEKTAPVDKAPPWLPERLEQAKSVTRKEILTELGVGDLGEAKAALEAHRKSQEESKSILDKYTDTAKALEAERQRATAYEATIKTHAERELGKLSETQREAVMRIAGEADHAGQLRAIDALLPTWEGQRQSAAEPAAAPVQQTQPATNTAPARHAPAPADVSNPDHAAVYQALRATNPILAARYAAQHPADVYKT